MTTQQLKQISGPQRSSARTFVLGAVFAATMLGTAVVQAFPSLGLSHLSDPNLSGSAGGSYTLVGNTGTFDYSGMTTSLTLGGNSFTFPTPGVLGNLQLDATIDVNTMMVSGSFSVTEVVGGSTMLSGSLTEFGISPIDELEFLFTLDPGGSRTGDFGGAGSSAGMILSSVGFSTSPSGIGAGFSDAAGTAGIDIVGVSVPAPGTLVLALAPLFAVTARRRRKV